MPWSAPDLATTVETWGPLAPIIVAEPPPPEPPPVEAPFVANYRVEILEPLDGLTDQSGRLWFGDGAQHNFNLMRGARGTASLVFLVDYDDVYEPTMGSPVYIYDDEVRVFAGTIDSIKNDWLIGRDDGTRLIYITAVSFEQCFDTIRVKPNGYTNQTAGTIFTQLLNGDAAGVPVTQGTISNGATITSLVIDNERVSDIFDQLATQSGYIWGVNPATLQIYFRAPGLVPAPYTLDSEDIHSKTIDWKQDRQDFRNRQIIRVSHAAFRTSANVFLGTGSETEFDLSFLPSQVVSAAITDATRSRAVGVLSANAAAGDTITVNDATYEFVTTLDNRIVAQVLLGSTKFATIQNLVDAINSNPDVAGVKFSLPTWENSACNATNGSTETVAALDLFVKWPGAYGNGQPLSDACSVFTWDQAATYGARDGSITDLNVGILGAETQQDLSYTPGSTRVTCAAPPPARAEPRAPSYLVVVYNRLGHDCIRVEDSALVALRAAAEHGTGKYHQMIEDTGNTAAYAGYQRAYYALQAFSELPSTFSFVTDDPGLTVGQLLTVTITHPAGADSKLDGEWGIQEVRGTLVPILPNFRYTVTVVNADRVPNYIDFWEQMVRPPGKRITPKGQRPTQHLPIRGIIPGIKTAQVDVFANPYQVRVPAGTVLHLGEVKLAAKVEPEDTDYELDILRSTDGSSYETIFNDGPATLPIGEKSIVYMPDYAIPILKDGDWIRGDIVATDEVTSGIEITIQTSIAPGTEEEA